VNLDDPQWREAFLLPSEAHGTVVQLAQPMSGPDDFARLVANAEGTDLAVTPFTIGAS